MPAATVKKTGKSLKKGRTSQTRLDEGDDLEEWKKSKQLLRPKDQLELTEAELKDVIARQLVTTNPQMPENLIQFNHALGAFELIPPSNELVTVYESQGTQLHKESQEARQQYVDQGLDPVDLLEDIESADMKVDEVEEVQPATEESLMGEDASVQPEDAEKDETEAEEEQSEEREAEAEPEVEGDVDTVRPEDEEDRPQTTGKPKKLTNQFNFCERAALTYNNPPRGQETQTIPPPMGTFSANVLQWIIYDAYLDDYTAQQLEKELERERKEKEKAPVSRHQAMAKKILGKAQLSEAVQGRVLECWKVLERMVNQNTYDDIAKDYRYWEDPSDEFREEEGTLLPLWKFTYDKTRKNTVTDLEWNPHYYDLFAVCFGFLDFMKPIDEGAVCLFTLKNPSFPDYICMTDSAVMCVDTHPQYPYMVVVGLYDGSVKVFNVQATCKHPAFSSNNVTNKHRGIVWEVKWAPDLPDGEMNFYSVSEDGKINNWVLMQNELAVTTIITLYLDKDEIFGPDGTKLRMKGAKDST